MKLVFATNNLNKVKEIKAVLGGDIEVLSLEDIGCNEELPETQNTLMGNALQKAKYVAEKYGVNCFSDDTGLEVHALSGAPGVYSARYAGEQKSAEDNMSKLLIELSGKESRSARFKTVIALVLNQEEFVFEGIVEGEITKKKSGKEGFGYDPIFQPSGFSVTFSEMKMEEKNEISHRGKAVKSLADFLNSRML